MLGTEFYGMNTVLSLEDWRDLALSSFIGLLSYIFADVYQMGEFNLLTLATFVAVFLGVFFLMQIVRRFKQENNVQ